MTAARPSARVINRSTPSALLESYSRHLLAARKRPNTIRGYTLGPRFFFEWGEENGVPAITEIKRRHIEDWLATLPARGRSSYTQRSYAVSLKLFFAWLAEEEEIPTNPAEKLKIPALDEVDKDVATPEEIRNVLAALEKAKRWRDVAAVALLYDTGMRAGEACSVRIEDVDFVEGTLRLRGTETKGRFGRTVPVSASCIRHLDRYLRRRSDTHPWLIASQRGQFTPQGLYRLVVKAFETTGRRIGPHDLRHTSATHMSAEVEDRDLQTIFGWKDPKHARHYTRQAHVTNAIAAHRRASPLERLGR